MTLARFGISLVALAGCATGLGGSLGISRSTARVTRTQVELPGRLVVRDRSRVHTTDDARFFVMEAAPIVEHRDDGGFGGGFLGGLGGSVYEGAYGATLLASVGVLVDTPRGVVTARPRMFFRLSLELQAELGGSDWVVKQSEPCPGRSAPDFIADRSPHRFVGLAPSIGYLGASDDGNGPPQPSEWVFGLNVSFRQIWEPPCLGVGP